MRRPNSLVIVNLDFRASTRLVPGLEFEAILWDLCLSIPLKEPLWSGFAPCSDHQL